VFEACGFLGPLRHNAAVDKAGPRDDAARADFALQARQLADSSRWRFRNFLGSLRYRPWPAAKPARWDVGRLPTPTRIGPEPDTLFPLSWHLESAGSPHRACRRGQQFPRSVKVTPWIVHFGDRPTTVPMPGAARPCRQAVSGLRSGFGYLHRTCRADPLRLLRQSTVQPVEAVERALGRARREPVRVDVG